MARILMPDLPAASVLSVFSELVFALPVQRTFD